MIVDHACYSQGYLLDDGTAPLALGFDPLPVDATAEGEAKQEAEEEEKEEENAGGGGVAEGISVEEIAESWIAVQVPQP